VPTICTVLAALSGAALTGQAGQAVQRDVLAQAAVAGVPGLERYDELRDNLAADATSRLSPYLHFGCVSPSEVAELALAREGGEGFVRQLCWRDFHHQLLAAAPAISRDDYRPRSAGWRSDPDGLEAWKQGRTGYPIVDAGMRQLLREGFMHNRARLVAASFLTKHLSIDWRQGAAHFYDHLVDGDVACNAGNWQWVAGTGTDTRPNRMLNPIRQAQRFDPEGLYARRYLPELGTAEYPEPLVEHEAAGRPPCPLPCLPPGCARTGPPRDHGV